MTFRRNGSLDNAMRTVDGSQYDRGDNYGDQQYA